MRVLLKFCSLIIDQISRIIVPLFAPLFGRASRTGIGSKACLKSGFLPLPVHYYSPVPDIEDLEARRIWDRSSEMVGINLDIEEQLRLLRRLGEGFGSECDWPSDPREDPQEFYTENNSFSFGCAAITHSMLRIFNPKRVVEIGSGFSSLIISTALQRNALAHEGSRPQHTIIDPYPSYWIQEGLSGVTDLIEERVEIMEFSIFDHLEENDVLFIDSGHTVRIGGDVNYLILEVLPRLKKGVLVHFHDIPLPRDYPRVYLINPSFRMLWTEGYLLQAFLCLNEEFKILLSMSYLMEHYNDETQAAFIHYNPSVHKLTSSSFWIQRSM